MTATQPPSSSPRTPGAAWSSPTRTAREHVGVVPVRAFPIGYPTGWLVLCDAEGRELRCIEDPTALPAEPRAPCWRRSWPGASSSRSSAGCATSRATWSPPSGRWRPIAARPASSCRTEDDVRRLGPYRALILDAQGIRYLVPDTRELDAYGRRAVERYL